MYPSIHKTAKALVVAAAALAFSVPAALAGPRPVDDYFRQGALTGSGVQIHPDDWFRASNTVTSLSADERYLNAVAHRNTSGVVVDDYFRTAPAERIAQVQTSTPGTVLAVDDYFRQSAGLGPQVHPDDWFRDSVVSNASSAGAGLSADERYLNAVASKNTSGAVVDDYFRDQPTTGASAAVAQSSSGGVDLGDALIGAGAGIGVLLLAAMGAAGIRQQRRQDELLKSA